MRKISIIVTALILAIGLPISYAADDPTLRGLWLFNEDGGDVVADVEQQLLAAGLESPGTVQFLRDRVVSISSTNCSKR